MPANRRSITAMARDLQAASNRLALANLHQDRDVILETIHAGNSKGAKASARIRDRGAVLAELAAQVERYRVELRASLDQLDTRSSGSR